MRPCSPVWPRSPGGTAVHMTAPPEPSGPRSCDKRCPAAAVASSPRSGSRRRAGIPPPTGRARLAVGPPERDRGRREAA